MSNVYMENAVEEINELAKQIFIHNQNLTPQEAVAKAVDMIVKIDNICNREITKENVSCSKQDEIKPYYIEGRGIFIPIINKVLAMEDAFDGKKVVWEKAVEAGAPTKDEWYIILYFKDEIQRLLKENGGQPLKDYYWSSSEYNVANSWGVNSGSGYIYAYYKTYTFTVRPVAAF